MLPSDELAQLAEIRMADRQREADAWRRAGEARRRRRRRPSRWPKVRVSVTWSWRDAPEPDCPPLA